MYFRILFCIIIIIVIYFVLFIASKFFYNYDNFENFDNYGQNIDKELHTYNNFALTDKPVANNNEYPIYNWMKSRQDTISKPINIKNKGFVGINDTDLDYKTTHTKSRFPFNVLEDSTKACMLKQNYGNDSVGCPHVPDVHTLNTIGSNKP